MEKKTPREYKIDRRELDRMVEREMDEYNLSYDFRHQWSDEQKRQYRNIRSNCYNKLRKKVNQKRANFWINTISCGNIKNIFREAGLVIHEDGSVTCHNGGQNILHWYLNHFVIAKLAKELNIKGLQITKNATVYSNNLFNWENIEIDDEKSE